ncbi:O-antigen ligase family protein [Niallia oryzisoli]|uniref:O-antigen ligase family protein n=1 Tax=Niallia oryzisoli TaxID=1737571 RepID=A0ABZ2CBC3_9BACI
MRKIAKTNLVTKNDDRKISMALMASYVVLTIQYFILISFNLLDTGSGAMVQLLSKGFVGLFFLYALPVVLKRRKIMFLGSYFIAIFVFLLHFLFFPENRIFIGEISVSFFLMCVPAFLYSLCLNDWNVLKEMMKKTSWIVFVFGVIAGIQIVLGGAAAGTYSMSLSYYILLPAILFTDKFFDKFSLKALLCAFLSVMVILALGSRGAILCIAVFMVFNLIKTHANFHYKRILLYLAILVSIILVLVNLERILLSLNDFLLKFGINSRSLRLFINEEVHLSGREKIYQDVMGKISEHPLIGIGLGGDRAGGLGYSHNLFLEIGANFGVIIGGMISMVLIFFIFRTIFLKNKEKSHMVIIWLCLGFVHLMVSGSYLIEMKFWILLGLLMNVHFLVPSKGESLHAQKENHQRYNLKYHRYGSAHYDSSTGDLTRHRYKSR